VISAFNKFMIEQRTKEVVLNSVNKKKRTTWMDIAQWIIVAAAVLTLLIDKINS
jgi:hypothetical protein